MGIENKSDIPSDARNFKAPDVTDTDTLASISPDQPDQTLVDVDINLSESIETLKVEMQAIADELKNYPTNSPGEFVISGGLAKSFDDPKAKNLARRFEEIQRMLIRDKKERKAPQSMVEPKQTKHDVIPNRPVSNAKTPGTAEGDELQRAADELRSKISSPNPVRIEAPNDMARVLKTLQLVLQEIGMTEAEYLKLNDKARGKGFFAYLARRKVNSVDAAVDKKIGK